MFIRTTCCKTSTFSNHAALALFRKIEDLLNLCEKDSLGEYLLGGLGSHIGISKLGCNEDTSNLGLLGVNLVDLHLDTSLSYIEDLVVLSKKLGISLLSGLKTGKGNSHIISGGSSTSLGVKEESSTVRRSVEVTSHLEARLETVSVTLADKVLHGEKERNTLSSWKLNGGCGVVNSLLLGEDDDSIILDGSLNCLKGVGLTGHDLGVDELLLGFSSLSNLLLNGPSLWLDTHLYKLLSSLGLDGILSDNLSTTVGKSSSLNLKVRELIDLGLGNSLGGGGGNTESNGSGKGNLSYIGHIILQGHLEAGGAAGGGGRSEGGGRSNEEGGECKLHIDLIQWYNV
mmetsp:Transcript_8676/g.12750  ORF Transcript_8676/g.12750 Transcript_8676/m.12750 type:complete len:343 (+) Transcript_8676:104-1132(+)